MKKETTEMLDGISKEILGSLWSIICGLLFIAAFFGICFLIGYIWPVIVILIVLSVVFSLIYQGYKLIRSKNYDK
jgi:hypothetical protein